MEGGAGEREERWTGYQVPSGKLRPKPRSRFPALLDAACMLGALVAPVLLVASVVTAVVVASQPLRSCWCVVTLTSHLRHETKRGRFFSDMRNDDATG